MSELDDRLIRIERHFKACYPSLYAFQLLAALRLCRDQRNGWLSQYDGATGLGWKKSHIAVDDAALLKLLNAPEE